MKNIINTVKQPKIARALIGLLVVISSISIISYTLFAQNRVEIENSIVTGPVSTIAPINQGILQEIDIYEGEYIAKGSVVGVINGQDLITGTNGIVTMANAQIGSIVSTQNPVAQIIDPSQMRIAGTIDENKGLQDIAVGQVVRFTIDALPGQTFWGYVDEISPSAKSTQIAFSISSERPTQQFIVYARFDALKYPSIKNGMSAKMTVFTK